MLHVKKTILRKEEFLKKNARLELCSIDKTQDSPE